MQSMQEIFSPQKLQMNMICCMQVGRINYKFHSYASGNYYKPAKKVRLIHDSLKFCVRVLKLEAIRAGRPRVSLQDKSLNSDIFWTQKLRCHVVASFLVAIVCLPLFVIFIFYSNNLQCTCSNNAGTWCKIQVQIVYFVLICKYGKYRVSTIKPQEHEILQ